MTDRMFRSQSDSHFVTVALIAVRTYLEHSSPVTHRMRIFPSSGQVQCKIQSVFSVSPDRAPSVPI
jgi:hypothetical protein